MADESLPRMAADLAEVERLRQQQAIPLEYSTIGSDPGRIDVTPPVPPRAPAIWDDPTLSRGADQIRRAADPRTAKANLEAQPSGFGDFALGVGEQALKGLGGTFDTFIQGPGQYLYGALAGNEGQKNAGAERAGGLFRFAKEGRNALEDMTGLRSQKQATAEIADERERAARQSADPNSLENMTLDSMKAVVDPNATWLERGAGVVGSGLGVLSLLAGPGGAGRIGKVLDPAGSLAAGGARMLETAAPKFTRAIDNSPAATLDMLSGVLGKAGTAAKEYVQGIPEFVRQSARGEVTPSVFFGPPSAKRQPVLTPKEAATAPEIKGEYGEEWRSLRDDGGRTLSLDYGPEGKAALQVAGKEAGFVPEAAAPADRYRDSVLLKIGNDLESMGLGGTYRAEDVLQAAMLPKNPADPLSSIAHELTGDVGHQAVQWDLANAGNGGFHLLPEFRGEAAMHLPDKGVEMFPKTYAEKFADEFTPEQLRAAYEAEAWKRAEEIAGVPHESTEEDVARAALTDLMGMERQTKEGKKRLRTRGLTPEQIAEAEAWAASIAKPKPVTRPHVEAEELLERGVANLRQHGFGKPMGPEPAPAGWSDVDLSTPPAAAEPVAEAPVSVREMLAGTRRRPEGPITQEQHWEREKRESQRLNARGTWYPRMQSVGGGANELSASYGLPPLKNRSVVPKEVGQAQRNYGKDATGTGAPRQFDSYMQQDGLPYGGGGTIERFPRQGRFFYDELPDDAYRDIFPYSTRDRIAREGDGPVTSKFVNHADRAMDNASLATSESRTGLYAVEDAVRKDKDAYRELTGDLVEGPNGLIFSKTQGIDAAFNPATKEGAQFYRLTGLSPDDFRFKTKAAQDFAEWFKQEVGVKRGQRAEDLGLVQEGGRGFTATAGGEVLPRRYHEDFGQIAYDGNKDFEEINRALQATFGRNYRMKGEDVLKALEGGPDRPANMESGRTLPWAPVAKRMDDGRVVYLQRTNLMPLTQGHVSPVENMLRSMDQRLAWVEEFGQNPPKAIQDALVAEGVDPKLYEQIYKDAHGLPSGAGPEEQPIYQLLGHGKGVGRQIARSIGRGLHDVALALSGAKSVGQTLFEVPNTFGLRNIAKSVAKALTPGYAKAARQEAIEAGALTRRTYNLGREAWDQSRVVESMLDSLIGRLSPFAWLKRFNTAIGDINQVIASESAKAAILKAFEVARTEGQLGAGRARDALRNIRLPEYAINRLGIAGPEEAERIVKMVMARGAWKTQYRDMPRLMRGIFQNNDSVNLWWPFREYSINTLKRTAENIYDIGKGFRRGDDGRLLGRQVYKMVNRLGGATVAGAAAGAITAWSRGKDRSDEGALEYLVNNLAEVGILGPLQYVADLVSAGAGGERIPHDPFGNIYVDAGVTAAKQLGKAGAAVAEGDAREAGQAMAEAIPIGGAGRGALRQLGMMEPAGDKHGAGRAAVRARESLDELLDSPPKRKRPSLDSILDGRESIDSLLDAPPKRKRRSLEEILD